MPRYLIERNFGRIDDEKMRGYSVESARILKDDMTGVAWVHSHVAIAPDGTIRTFCVYVAPDVDHLHEHADRLGGHEIEAIYEIGGDVAPSDFIA